MTKLLSVAAGAALAVSLAAAPVDRAKADGGAAVAIGVGAYLVVDYIVGEKCQMYKWPFNMIKKTAYKIKGKPVCEHYRKDREYK